MSRVIQGAVELLNEPKNGWCRGVEEYTNDKGGTDFCLVGALKRAAFGPDLYNQFTVGQDEQYRTAQSAVMLALHNRGTYPSSIEHWNDHGANDVDEVLEILKLADEIIDMAQDTERRYVAARG